MTDKNHIVNINIIDLVKLLLSDKKKIALYSCTAGVIGVLLAFGTPKEYKSTVMLAPEESGGGFAGSLSSLSSMVGLDMNFGQTGDALYPEIYPDLVSSTDFVIGMFPVKITTKDGNVKCDYYTYLERHQKLAVSDYPKALFVLVKEKLSKQEPSAPIEGKQEGPISLSRKQENVVKAISSMVDCSVDKKTNVITITVKDQDPYVAAHIADSIKQHLQIAITEYRTKKARIDMEYMSKLYAEAKADYEKARLSYAAYSDTHQSTVLQKYKTKESDLENEMQLKYNIFQTVAEQLQLAKAKVQEKTPAFTVMQSATVPNKHCNRPKIVTLVIWMILGFMLRTCILLWKNKEKFISI